MTQHPLPVLLISAAMLAGCATYKPPAISYDTDVPPLPTPEIETADLRPRPLLNPPRWTPARGGEAGAEEADEPLARVEVANAAARVEPRKAGYYNAVQVYPFSAGALYQIYAAPGRVTDIALQPGEQLIGSGPVSAGDTTRWIIGDTESGNGADRRVHILVKPTEADIDTNLIVNTDRRTYAIELRAREAAYMPAIAWTYPDSPSSRTRPVFAGPRLPPATERRFRYRIEGDTPPWRPLAAYDDGRKVYIEFPRGIVQGEMPPLFVIGPDGKPELVNTRIFGHLIIVDRLFAAAELRLGGRDQQIVRIVRSDGRPST